MVWPAPPAPVAAQSAALSRRIRRLVKVEAARSLQPADLAQGNRYQFAHGTLLEQAQLNEDLNDPEFVDRIHQWADSWRAAGWPYAGSGENVTPQYLLDTYPSTLTEDPQRLADLVSDAGWLEAAVLSVGVDHVLVDLRRAAAASPASEPVAAMFVTASGQAHYLRPPWPVDQPGYVALPMAVPMGDMRNVQTKGLQTRPQGHQRRWRSWGSGPSLS